MTEKIPVHIVDSDEAACLSLVRLLSSHGYPYSTYSGEQFVSTLSTSTIGCVIADILMPIVNGLDLLAMIKNLALSLPVILVSDRGNIRLAVKAMRAGAIDFLEKPYSDQLVLESLHLAAVAKNIASKIDPSENEIQTVEQKFSRLTAREREVLRGVLLGASNKRLAIQLGISSRTVEAYRANVMTKTGAANLPDLVRLATSAGVFP